MVAAEDGRLEQAAVPRQVGEVLDRSQANRVLLDGPGDLAGELRVGEIQAEVNILAGNIF